MMTIALAVVVVVPLVIAVFLGWVSTRGVTPNIYECAHCHARFRAHGHRPFPDRCPSCHTTDWPTAR